MWCNVRVGTNLCLQAQTGELETVAMKALVLRMLAALKLLVLFRENHTPHQSITQCCGITCLLHNAVVLRNTDKILEQILEQTSYTLARINIQRCFREEFDAELRNDILGKI